MASKTVTAKQREQLNSLLGNRASYVLLKDESKEPVGRYRLKNGNTPRARKDSAPLKGNYGIIPQGEFFILDLDVHRGELKDQLAFFEEIFGVDLSETLVVKTPSGGYHYYLRLPYGFNQPIFNGSLRSYAKHLMENTGKTVDFIDADIRSSEATGYVVGPGSHVSIGKKNAPYKTPGGYTLEGDSKYILSKGEFKGLAEISEGGAELLRHLRALQLEKRAPTGIEKPEEEKEEAPLLEHAPSQEVLTRVNHGLKKKLGDSSEFHRKRSFLLAALRCCYSDYALAAACVKLGIDRDSYTRERLPFWETVADMKGLRTPGSVEHTSYCDIGHAERYKEGQSLEDRLARLKKKVENRTLARKQHFSKHQVINMGKVIRKLDQGTPKVPQRVRDAVLVMDTLFQPLYNVGATRVVVARKPVAEALGLTESRIADAMRLLRDRGIIEVRNRQRTGLASTYSVQEEFIHKLLTGSLKHRWVLLKEKEGQGVPLLYNRFDNSFHELEGERTHRVDGTVKRDWRIELGIPPEVPLEIFAQAYLKSEQAHQD